MLIEDLLIEIDLKKDIIKYINNYIIDEITENHSVCNGLDNEAYSKIIVLLNINLLTVQSMEEILNLYQNKVDEHYKKILSEV